MSEFTVVSVAEVRNQFRQSVEALVASAKGEWESATNKGPAKNYEPALNGWSGDLFDLEGMSKAFSREENKVDMQKAIADARKSGTVGDLIASVKQGDYLAVQERAFRLKHCGRVRATVHAGARMYGHQHKAGLLNKGVIGEVEDIVRKAKNFA